MRKGCDGEVKVVGKGKKRMVKIAFHYRRASQPPEWGPSGTPITCANIRRPKYYNISHLIATKDSL